MSRPSEAVYFGTVTHRRLRPIVHHLRYEVASLLVDVDALGKGQHPSLLGYNRWNLFSLNDDDHGERDGKAISAFAWQKVREAGGEGIVTHIMMLSYPRILGYAFNPLTTFYALDSEGRTCMMIYEVHNTFGGRHCYLTPMAGPEGMRMHRTKKVFRVSPFNRIEGEYALSSTEPAAAVTLSIALTTSEGPLLNAYFTGHRKPLSNSQLLRIFFGLPFMTLKVISAIHWQALKLWLKGLKLQSP